MKKLFALSLMLIGLASCSDDDTSSVNLDNLQKRWYNVSTIVSGQKIPYDGNPTCGKDYMEFQASNVLREIDWVDCQTDPTTTTGTYTAVDKTLTTVLDGETITYSIKKLSGTSLQLSTSFNGTVITYVYTSTPK